MENKKNILHECITTHPGRNKLKTFEYNNTESVLLEWFRQKWHYMHWNSNLRFFQVEVFPHLMLILWGPGKAHIYSFYKLPHFSISTHI
jgi:hypothetical protein